MNMKCMDPVTDEEINVCMQMTMNMKDTIGVFLIHGWKATNFGEYFGTLLFVTFLCVSIELIPFLRTLHAQSQSD